MAIGDVGVSSRQRRGANEIDPAVARAGAELAGSFRGLVNSRRERIASEEAVADAQLNLRNARLNKQDGLDRTAARTNLIKMNAQFTRDFLELQRNSPLGAPNFEATVTDAANARATEFLSTVPPHLQSEFAPELESFKQSFITGALEFELGAQDGVFVSNLGELQTMATDDILGGDDPDQAAADWLEQLDLVLSESPMDAAKTEALRESTIDLMERSLFVRDARDRELAAGTLNGTLYSDTRIYDHDTRIDFAVPDSDRPDRPILDVAGAAAERVFGLGSRIEVFSGVRRGEADPSHRHRTGKTADMRIYRPDGSIVLATSDAMKEFAREAFRLGARGIGFGSEYMGGNSLHLDLVGKAAGGGNFWQSGATSIGGELTAILNGRASDPNVGPAHSTTKAIVDYIVHNESRGDPNAVNTVTGAAVGLGQMMPETWMGLISQYRPELLEGKTRDEVLAMRTDGKLNYEMTTRYVEQNIKGLKAAGMYNHPGDAYLAHFLGLNGAKHLLSQDDSAMLSDVLPEKVLAANPLKFEGKTIRTMNVGELRRMFYQKMGGEHGPKDSSDLMSDPRFNSIPYLEKEKLLGEAERFAAGIAAEQQEASKRMAEEQKRLLELGLADGTYGPDDIQVLADEQGWSLKEREEAYKIFEEKNQQTLDALEFINGILADPMTTFDSTSKKHKDAAHAYFAEGQATERFKELDSDYIELGVLPAVRETSYLPPAVGNALAQQAYSRDPQQALFALDAMAQLSLETPEAFANAVSDNIATMVAGFNAGRGLVPDEQLLAYIRQRNDPQYKAVFDNAKLEISQNRRDNPSDFSLPGIIAGFDSRFSGADALPVDGAQGVALSSEFQFLYNQLYPMIGDHEKAVEAVRGRMEQRWGVFEFDGGASFMKYPPNKVGAPSYRGGYDYISDQLKELFPTEATNVTLKLVNDGQTAAEVEGQQQASYLVGRYVDGVFDGFMKYRDTAEYEGIATEPDITNETIRYSPTITEQMLQAEVARQKYGVSGYQSPEAVERRTELGRLEEEYRAIAEAGFKTAADVNRYVELGRLIADTRTKLAVGGIAPREE